MSASSPVIVIGMHRSGTSLLTRALEELGLFMGVNTTRNQEARFTNAVNDWLLAQAGAYWFTPEPIDDLLRDDSSRPLIEAYLGGLVAGPACLRFLGLRRYLRYRSLHRVTEPWGWKDPRNSFTLPVWLGIFPRARVLHIMRHGVDVAASLRTRRREALARAEARLARLRPLYTLDPTAPGRRRLAHAIPCGQLDTALDLWSRYSRRARSHVWALGDRALELRYEDLLAAPQDNLSRIASFCGLSLDEATLVHTAARFDTSRAFAYRRDPELAAFARTAIDRLAALGYEP
ncbi:sulfotransferase family protein [Thiococcus pfennigii]|uniref:sulfotransferase family protein n=1 Tax=Thiococcus pfennigii TaxID=1057 RepID=UPI00190447C8|nr:sulfotransferase [Thiococcus pfennigii]MBK1699671.1 hypothetical protein [Thiococcus pfennigii]MBK1733232.1 hypothetical protein [Thiococcus pfennigii]